MTRTLGWITISASVSGVIAMVIANLFQFDVMPLLVGGAIGGGIGGWVAKQQAETR